MGTLSDLERQQNLRVDDTHRRRKIENAQKLIYVQGKSITSKKVEGLLAEESLVPTRASTNCSIMWGLTMSCTTQNAFSSKLAAYGFKLYPLFIVDQLHEIELGVWKLILTHLIRILHALPKSGSVVTELDTR